MGDDVDPEDPRPDGHYHAHRNAEWYHIDGDLAGTIALGPATDGEPGDDWVLTLLAATPDGDPDAAERVAVRLTPWALHELYIGAPEEFAEWIGYSVDELLDGAAETGTDTAQSPTTEDTSDTDDSGGFFSRLFGG
ncbi:hypothetical protein C463_00425 [Halorubrum californiense DSM 19288]|uniref:DUF8161 domain-containing protein n=1 Tax=Halorubrum californiense DSM 19288 TaxID=1227465 RepID=M0EM14_9EURY|nr:MULTISPECIES: hypothetical protein [Halorubrum]ELZ48780.1 hypothetical protein C463_00425 [Halorubrum californiense DSM 19288]TKX72011.1 hypothetical protein EXE40_05920 [Halorubrum sp. GN11GM_10-3_MGM]